jgi:hypothetical protein
MTERDWVAESFALKLEYANFLKRVAKFNEEVRKFGWVGYHGTPTLSMRHINEWARCYNSATPAQRRRMMADE